MQANQTNQTNFALLNFYQAPHKTILTGKKKQQIFFPEGWFILLFVCLSLFVSILSFLLFGPFLGRFSCLKTQSFHKDGCNDIINKHVLRFQLHQSSYYTVLLHQQVSYMLSFLKAYLDVPLLYRVRDRSVLQPEFVLSVWSMSS